MKIIALGHWFHAGQSQKDIALVSIEEECKVVFGNVPLTEAFAHGFFTFLPLDANKFQLILAFHKTNTNDDVKPIAMRQVAGNLWMERQAKDAVLHLHHVNRAFILYDALKASSELLRSKDYIRNELNLEVSPCMHAIVQWLHPRCEPTYIALLKDGQGIMMKQNDGTWGKANGIWQFTNMNGQDSLTCHFHWKGEVDNAGIPKAFWTLLGKIDVPQSLLVEKLDTERQTFRAIGGSTEPKSSTGQILEPGLMKSWHIVAQFIWFANEGE